MKLINKLLGEGINAKKVIAIALGLFLALILLWNIVPKPFNYVVLFLGLGGIAYGFYILLQDSSKRGGGMQ